jgi:hypothetical protein
LRWLFHRRERRFVSPVIDGHQTLDLACSVSANPDSGGCIQP